MLSTTDAARGSFEFDCIDADYADGVEGVIESAFNEGITKPFAVVRIVTTHRRFEEIAGGPGDPGNWFALEIGSERSAISLPTWHAQLQPNGFPVHSRGVTSNITYLGPGGDDGHRPRSVGAAVTRQAIVPSAIISACALPPSPNAAQKIAGVLSSVSGISTLRVRDVGQASFSSLCNKYGKALLHYDVGFPISFNGHTAPEIFDLDASEKPHIILSHWDWDHLHAEFLYRHLMDCVWIVPTRNWARGPHGLPEY
jgi:competence protein ComEC